MRVSPELSGRHSPPPCRRNRGGKPLDVFTPLSRLIATSSPVKGTAANVPTSAAKSRTATRNPCRALHDDVFLHCLVALCPSSRPTSSVIQRRRTYSLSLQPDFVARRSSRATCICFCAHESPLVLQHRSHATALFAYRQRHRAADGEQAADCSSLAPLQIRTSNWFAVGLRSLMHVIQPVWLGARVARLAHLLLRRLMTC